MLHYCVISYITDKVVSRGVSELSCATDLVPGHTYGVGETSESAYEHARERCAKARKWWESHIQRGKK